MKKIFVTTLVILGLVLVVAIVYCVAITKDRDALNIELKSVQSVLASTQAELGSTKNTLELAKQTLTSTHSELNTTKMTLAFTQYELTSTNQTLTSTQSILNSTKQTLISTQSELSSTKQTLSSVQQASTNLQATLSTTQQQLAVAEETLGGLGITLSTVKLSTLSDNSGATNPTWGQLMTFLSEDQTEKHPYIKDVYDCSEFSRDVHNNAEARGIRAAVVSVDFRYETTGHALNAFLTTDYGLVYVDCVSLDMIARVKTGKEYRAVEIGSVTGTNVRNDYWWDARSSYYYIPSSTRVHSVTSSIGIYW